MRALVALGLAAALGGCGGENGSADRTPEGVTPEEARKCLREAGFQTTESPRSADDRDAPDHELIVSDRGPRALIGFYDDLNRAEHFEPEIRQSAPRFRGSVKRRDKVTVVWTREPGREIRARVYRCAFRQHDDA